MTDIIGIEIAILVVTISLILSGIILGLGKAFSLKRAELFGLEELTQSIINGALIGGIALIIETIQTISQEVMDPICSESSLIKGVECTFSTLSGSLFFFSQELTKLTILLGYYQSLVLDFDILQIQLFENLSAVSNIFSAHLLFTNILIILLNLNLQILSFFAESSLALFLPLGLIFRSFFATRKIGGFLIALSIGIYLFYPAFIAIFPSPVGIVGSAASNMSLVTNSSEYATIPIIDLNDNYALAEKLDNMSQGSFVSDLTLIQQTNSKAISDVSLYAVFAPLFSLFLTIIFVKGLGDILGGELSFSWGVI